MKAKILGRVWDVRFVANLGETEDGEKVRGNCDSPKTPAKAIRILNSLEGEEQLDVIIHEFAHAADWWKDEEFIEQFGSDLARLLTRLGYKRETNS